MNSQRAWQTRLQVAALLSAMTVGTINVWTGVPLLGLWVGSRVVRSGTISMLAVLVIVVTMAASAWILLVFIARVDARLRRVTGRDRTVARHTPWLRSMRGERERGTGVSASLEAADYVMVAVVVVAVVTFEVWFMFFSGSPLDQRSGR